MGSHAVTYGANKGGHFTARGTGKTSLSAVLESLTSTRLRQKRSDSGSYVAEIAIRSNWGWWGADDQLGTLKLTDQSDDRHAVTLFRAPEAAAARPPER
jgi:hypothetical protein